MVIYGVIHSYQQNCLCGKDPYTKDDCWYLWVLLSGCAAQTTYQLSLAEKGLLFIGNISLSTYPQTG